MGMISGRVSTGAALLHNASAEIHAGAASKINSSVFARRPESFETGALQLQRVAAWGPDAACTVGARRPLARPVGRPITRAVALCMQPTGLAHVLHARLLDAHMRWRPSADAGSPCAP